jgi:hypothetical protein
MFNDMKYHTIIEFLSFQNKTQQTKPKQNIDDLSFDVRLHYDFSESQEVGIGLL